MGDGSTSTTVTSTSTTGRPAGKDRLKLAGRMDLHEGERLIDSDKVTGDFGTVRVAAVTDRTGVVALRLGLGGPAYGSREDAAGPWLGGPDPTVALNARRKVRRDEREAVDAELTSLEAEPATDPVRKAALEARYRVLDDMDLAEVYPLGYTAVLNQRAVQQLRATLAGALAAEAEIQGVADAYWTEHDHLEAIRDGLRGMTRKWTPEEEARWDTATADLEALAVAGPDVKYTIFAEGSIPASWADIHYRVELDDPGMGVDAILAAVPHGPDHLTLDELCGVDAAARLNRTQATKILRILARHGGPKTSGC
ncbi:hypothetical protein [Micromonospora sp. NPDC048830]|uniref:hypothetical protein n=1 Tax=Micromonospora sp. NPDC048830 TaxID=3364257 RepID=UPI003722D494